MVTAVVDNHGVKKLTCNLHLLCSEEDMTEGGRDNGNGPQGIFLPSKKPNLKSGRIIRIISYYKNAQGQLVEDGSPICRSCEKKVVARGVSTSSLLIHLFDHHHQLLSGQSSATASTSHSTVFKVYFAQFWYIILYLFNVLLCYNVILFAVFC